MLNFAQVEEHTFDVSQTMAGGAGSASTTRPDLHPFCRFDQLWHALRHCVHLHYNQFSYEGAKR